VSIPPGISNKQKAELFLQKLSEPYKSMPKKELKKLLMHSEVYLHKSIVKEKNC